MFRKISQVLMCLRLFQIFYCISFSVSGFIWRSLNHLDLTFLKGNKNGSICIFLHADFQLNQHHLLKMLSFFQWIVLAPLSKIKCPYVCRFNSRSSIYCIDLPVCHCTRTMQSFSQLLCRSTA